MRPNANVQAELQRLRDEWDRGAVDGDETMGNSLPDFCLLPYKQLTAYQRGYLLAWELRRRERMDHE